MSAETELAALKAAWGRVRDEVSAYDRLVTQPTSALLSIGARAGRPKVELRANITVSSTGNLYNAVTRGGIDNTGSTSVTSAILNAITVYKNSGYSGLYFPAGTYRMDTPLHVPTNTVMSGESMTNTWLKGRVQFDSYQAWDGIRMGDVNLGLRGYVGTAHHTTFYRCKFRGGGSSLVQNDQPNIKLQYSQNYITFEECHVEANLGPHYISGSSHTITDNVRIDPATGTGVPSIHHILFKNCVLGAHNGVTDISPRFNVEIWEPQTGVANLGGHNNINFEGCTFERSQDEALDYSGNSRAANNPTPNSGWSHVTGCLFKGDGYAPYQFYGQICIEAGCCHIDISNNTFYRGAGAAVAMEDGGPYNTFTNNTVNYVTPNTGITHYWVLAGVASSNNTITGNYFELSTSFSTLIQLQSGSSYNTVTGNTIKFGGRSGILNEGSNNTITPNTLLT